MEFIWGLCVRFTNTLILLSSKYFITIRIMCFRSLSYCNIQWCSKDSFYEFYFISFLRISKYCSLSMISSILTCFPSPKMVEYPQRIIFLPSCLIKGVFFGFWFLPYILGVCDNCNVWSHLIIKQSSNVHSHVQDGF